MSNLLDLRVGLVRLVAGRELGWDGVIVIKVDVGGVGMFGRVVEVENAVVAVVVVVAVAVVFVADAVDTGDAAVDVAVVVVVVCDIVVGVV